ncbi:hypothetical protein HG531_009680 [Fusarium graminearum]|nr:hypothetical protein HG531_009680 [Fusarium graminearum]
MFDMLDPGGGEDADGGGEEAPPKMSARRSVLVVEGAIGVAAAEEVTVFDYSLLNLNIKTGLVLHQCCYNVLRGNLGGICTVENEGEEVDNLVLLNFLHELFLLVLPALEQSISILTNTPSACLFFARHGVSMPLNSIGLNGDNLDQSVESNISNVVVAVGEELAQNIDTKDSQARIGLNIENPGSCESFQSPDKSRDERSELFDDSFFSTLLLICLAKACHQGKTAQKNAMVSIRNLATYAHGAEGRLSSNIGVGGSDKGFDFGEEVSGHLNRGDVS